MIADQAEGMTEQSARTGPAVQSTSAKTSATLMGADTRTSREVEQEEELQAEETREVCVPMQEELAMAGASTPPPTPAHT